MPSARFWDGGRLLAGWIVAVAGLVLLRWVLVRGVYVMAVEDGRLIRVSGHWPAEFATLITGVTVGMVVVVLTWLTVTWVAGRRERAAQRIASVAARRRIVM